MRPRSGQKSIVNFDWLSPFSVYEILRGKKILEDLRAASGDNVSTYNYHEYVIKANTLRKGIQSYDMALRIFMGATLKRHELKEPETEIGQGKWNDLSGLLLPESEELKIVDDVKNGNIQDINEVLERFRTIHDNYPEYRWTYAYRLIRDYYRVHKVTEEHAECVREDYVTARRAWIAEIRSDAEKEFEQGDVEEDLLTNFLQQLDKEHEYEQWK